jgi:hypothetical protein
MAKPFQKLHTQAQYSKISGFTIEAFHSKISSEINSREVSIEPYKTFGIVY